MWFIQKNPMHIGLWLACAGAIQFAQARTILSPEAALKRTQTYAPFLAQQRAQTQLNAQNLAFAQQRPPPQLLFQREDQGANLPSFVVGISQNLNGKQREFAVKTAELQQNLAQTQFAQTQLQRDADTMNAYLAWQIAESQTQIQQNIENIAQKIHETAQIRLNAGAISPVEAARTALNLAQQRAQTQAAAQSACQAALGLAILWGETENVCANQQAAPLSFALPEKLFIEILPEESNLAQQISLNYEIKHAAQHQNIAQRDGVPTVFLNLRRPDRRHGQPPDSDSFTLGFTLPLPWNTRGDAIQRAFVEANQAQKTAQQAGLHLTWQSRAMRLQAEFANAKQQLALIETQQMPLAESIVARSQLGYAAGKFDLNAVLAAQDALLLLQKQRLQYLGAGWSAVYAARYFAAGF